MDEDDGPAHGSEQDDDARASPPSARALLRMAAFFYALCALFAGGFALLTGRLGGLFGSRWPDAIDLLAGLLVGLAVVALTRVAARTWRPFDRLADALADMLGPLAWHQAILLALLSGFVEELLFRGALWPALGLVGTTVLFGLVHTIPRRPIWLYPLFALVVGLLFGLLREGTLSLWPPVVAHVTINATNLVWIGRRAQRRAAGDA